MELDHELVLQGNGFPRTRGRSQAYYIFIPSPNYAAQRLLRSLATFVREPGCQAHLSASNGNIQIV